MGLIWELYYGILYGPNSAQARSESLISPIWVISAKVDILLDFMIPIKS